MMGELWNVQRKSANNFFPDDIEKRYSINLKHLVEPTRNVLDTTLWCIYFLYSSVDAFDFFNYINVNTLELSNSTGTDCLLYDPLLPNEYIMEDDILCEGILRTCMSEAKGSIANIHSLANILWKNEVRKTWLGLALCFRQFLNPLSFQQTTKITGASKRLDRGVLFKSLSDSLMAMAKASKTVPKNGHAYFKSNIMYDLMNFDNDQLNCGGKTICPHLDFLEPIALLDPLVATLIVFGPN